MAAIKSCQKGELSHRWKGDEAGYAAIHIWVKNNKPKPAMCEHCKKRPPLDLANISGEYKRDVNDFEWLCRRCHMLSDGRMKNLDITRKWKKEQKPNWKGGNKRNTCVDCKTKIHRGSIRCRSCRAKEFWRVKKRESKCA